MGYCTAWQTARRRICTPPQHARKPQLHSCCAFVCAQVSWRDKKRWYHVHAGCECLCSGQLTLPRQRSTLGDTTLSKVADENMASQLKPAHNTQSRVQQCSSTYGTGGGSSHRFASAYKYHRVIHTGRCDVTHKWSATHCTRGKCVRVVQVWQSLITTAVITPSTTGNTCLLLAVAVGLLVLLTSRHTQAASATTVARTPPDGANRQRTQPVRFIALLT